MATNEYRLSLGERILLFRRRKGLSGVQLAEAAGVDSGTLSRYEHGQREPSASVLYRLAKALGVTPNDLLDDDSAMGRLLSRVAAA